METFVACGTAIAIIILFTVENSIGMVRNVGLFYRTLFVTKNDVYSNNNSGKAILVHEYYNRVQSILSEFLG